MAGRIFLLVVIAGLVWGGMRVYEVINETTSPKAFAGAPKETGEQAKPASTPRATPPRSESERHVEIVVLASTADGVLVEAWGWVQRGGRLPGGLQLHEWHPGELVVSGKDGRTSVSVPPVGHLLALRSKASESATGRSTAQSSATGSLLPPPVEAE